jgi:hypothetical protein
MQWKYMKTLGGKAEKKLLEHTNMGTNFKASIIIRHKMKIYHKSSSLLNVKIF